MYMAENPFSQRRGRGAGSGHSPGGRRLPGIRTLNSGGREYSLGELEGIAEFENEFDDA